jgi:hypothetical protein
MKNFVLIGSCAFLLVGCIPSVNPFYTPKDLVFEPQLVGQWQAKDDSEQPAQWQFEKKEDMAMAYKLTVTEEKTKKGEFTAHLFKLGNEYFLDIIPSKCDYAPDQAGLTAAAMFAGHLLFRMNQIGPELKMASFDFDWLKTHLEKNPNDLAYHEEDDAVVLTAGTADLQRFLLAHLGEGQLFKKESTLARNAPAGAAAYSK